MKMKQLLMTTIAIFGLVIISNAQVPNYVPSNGLVGWWPFNGNANDESLNGNNGIVNGATLTQNRFGESNKAYYFNGASFIDCGSSDQMAMTNNLTLSCWGKTTYQFSNLCIAGRWSNVSFDPAPFGTPEYCIVFNNTDVSSCIVISTPPNEYVSAPITYYDNQWHQFTMTYDGAINKIFIDGNLASQGNFSGNIQSFVNKFVVGTYGLGGFPDLPNSWIGDIDDVGLWNRALTEEEITSLYSVSPLGINEDLQSNLFSVFPNPAQNVINVNLDAKHLGSVFTIYDSIGKAVKTGKINSVNTAIELNNLSGGIYTFSVGENKKQTFKVIKE